MSKSTFIRTYVKRNRPTKTQCSIFISAAAVSTLFMAVSTVYGARASQPLELPALKAEAGQVVPAAETAKSTLAPLEDSVETIAKAGNALKVEAEKTQDLLDKPKEALALADKKPAKGFVAATAVPEALKEVPETTSKEIAAAPAYVLQAAAPVWGPAGSAYPYATVPFPNSTPDPWGMYMRQCVSYTAWKVAASGRYMPYWGGRGNAAQWDENARAAGIPVDTVPRVGSVAIDHSIGGSYGHSAYVEAVHDDGTITVSQYNINWDGTYSEERRSAAGLVFIHF